MCFISLVNSIFSFSQCVHFSFNFFLPFGHSTCAPSVQSIPFLTSHSVYISFLICSFHVDNLHVLHRFRQLIQKHHNLQDLYPQFGGRNYLLHEYDAQQGTLSLSRCTNLHLQFNVISKYALKWLLVSFMPKLIISMSLTSFN